MLQLLVDIDGTIVDNRMRVYGLYEQYGRERGFPVLSASAYLDVKKSGAGERDVAGRSFPPEVIGEYLEWKRSLIETPSQLARDVLVPGVKDALELLASSNHLFALSARQSNELLLAELERLGVSRFFDASLPAGDQKSVAIKVFLTRSDIHPEAVIVIGDTEVEIVAARETRVGCVSVAWGLRSRSYLVEQGANCVVTSVRKLCNVIEHTPSRAFPGEASLRQS